MVRERSKETGYREKRKWRTRRRKRRKGRRMRELWKWARTNEMGTAKGNKDN